MIPGASMPSATFDWRQHGPDEARHQFYAYLHSHPEANEEDFYRAFLKGAQWAVRATSALSPSIAAMVAFVDWLHEHELELTG
jgi:hypothetical protein